MHALDSWHVLYTSYDSTSPEPFQKLNQSSEVSRRVDDLFSNVIFVAIQYLTWVMTRNRPISLMGQPFSQQRKGLVDFASLICVADLTVGKQYKV